MANSKISALTSATTPLAGTETLPVVQSSATTKVTVANLTAGRAVSAASLSLTTTPLPVSSGGTGLSTLAAGRIPFGSSATTFSSASVLSWDNTNTRFGVGTGSPTQTLSVVGASFVGASFNGQSYGDSTERLRVGYKDGTPDTGLVPAQIIASTVQLQLASRDNANGAIIFSTGSGVVERMRWFGSGGVSIGDTTDPSAGNLRMGTGNVVQGTAAKGFNFTANTPAAGMTSQLLNWYEEGTFTPIVSGTTTAGTGTYTQQAGQYTRIGNRLFFVINLGWTAHTGTGNMFISGFPFTSANIANTASPMSVRVQNLALTAGNVPQFYMSPNQNYFILAQVPVGGGAEAAVPIDTNASIFLSGQYQI